MEEEKKEIEEEETDDSVTPAEEINETEEAEAEEEFNDETEDEAEAGEDQIDYDAVLAQEKERAERNRKGYELRKKKPVTEDVSKVVEEKLEAMRMEMVQDTIDAQIEAISPNPKERELIKFYYDNKLIKSGFTRAAIKEDLETAKAMANAKKIVKQNKEMAETIKAKKSMGGGGYGANLDKPSPKKDLSKHFAKHEWEFIQQRGWTEKQIKDAIALKKESFNNK